MADIEERHKRCAKRCRTDQTWPSVQHGSWKGCIQETDQVLSIHISKSWTPTPELATNMARFVMGTAKKQGKNFDIEVIDSLNTSIGLGMIVVEAAELAREKG